MGREETYCLFTCVTVSPCQLGCLSSFNNTKIWVLSICKCHALFQCLVLSSQNSQQGNPLLLRYSRAKVTLMNNALPKAFIVIVLHCLFCKQKPYHSYRITQPGPFIHCSATFCSPAVARALSHLRFKE